MGNFKVTLTVTLEGCGEKVHVCFQCFFESDKRVRPHDVDWQGTSLGKAAVSPGCAGSWDDQLQTLGVGPQ